MSVKLFFYSPRPSLAVYLQYATRKLEISNLFYSASYNIAAISKFAYFVKFTLLKNNEKKVLTHLLVLHHPK